MNSKSVSGNGGNVTLVMFDIYGTIAGFYPPREVIQSKVAQLFGLKLTPQGINKGYRLANEFINEENEKHPVRLQTPAERNNMLIRFEQFVLSGDGYKVDFDLASQIWAKVQKQNYTLELFPDVLPVLEYLIKAGYKTGIITNMVNSEAELIQQFDLYGKINFIITSQDTKAQKPQPDIFIKALQRAEVLPQNAVYVGDDIHSDVQGAIGVGILPVLIDRYQQYTEYREHLCITSITALIPLLSRLNTAGNPPNLSS